MAAQLSKQKFTTPNLAQCTVTLLQQNSVLEQTTDNQWSLLQNSESCFPAAILKMLPSLRRNCTHCQK
jgi:hypothetical protein